MLSVLQLPMEMQVVGGARAGYKKGTHWLMILLASLLAGPLEIEATRLALSELEAGLSNLLE
jgi:hypothetical protein